MQARHQMRAGQALHAIDLAKQDLVQRDQPVTLIYKAAGIYLTVRGKAVDNGTDGDVVNAVNLQSKRTVTGVVVGRGQIEISPVMPRQVASAVPAAPADTADTHDVHVSPKAE
jgi:flagella basal body P-ring formation protein FlgA